MLRRSMPAWILAAAMIAGQAFAYAAFLPLSLGPRVVLQPWLLQRGFLLYDQVADEHAPLLSLLLTWLQPLAGNSLLLAKAALVVLLAIITLLVFISALRADGKAAGIIAVAFMALWSPDFGYGKLWHETLLAMLYTLILLAWRPGRGHQAGRRAAVVTGLLFGLSVLAKQHAGLVALGVACWTWLVGRRSGRRLRTVGLEILLMTGAALIPVALLVAYHLWLGGTVASLAYWTLGFSLLSNQAGLSLLWPPASQLGIVAPAFLLLLPFALNWWAGRRSADERWQREGLALILLFTGSLTVFPRFSLFHLQPSLPILAWISSLSLVRLTRQVRTAWRSPGRVAAGLLVATFVALWLVAGGREYWGVPTKVEEPQITEYSELVPLAGELRRTIPSGESVYVMPDNEGVANLYYLLQAEPPRFWVPTDYPWFMIPNVRARALAELRLQPPEWIIDVPDGWNFQSTGRPILDFVQANYQSVAQIHWNGGEVHLLHRRSMAEKR